MVILVKFSESIFEESLGLSSDSIAFILFDTSDSIAFILFDIVLFSYKFSVLKLTAEYGNI